MQKNVDDAAAQLRMKGIDVIGVVCHVNNADQRKNLIKTTMEVSFSILHCCWSLCFVSFPGWIRKSFVVTTKVHL